MRTPRNIADGPSCDLTQDNPAGGLTQRHESLGAPTIERAIPSNKTALELSGARLVPALMK